MVRKNGSGLDNRVLYSDYLDISEIHDIHCLYLLTEFLFFRIILKSGIQNIFCCDQIYDLFWGVIKSSLFISPSILGKALMGVRPVWGRLWENDRD